MKWRGVTIAFLGIDGSGKSTHAKATKRWLAERGVRCYYIPFHKWLFADKLKAIAYQTSDRDISKKTLAPKIMKKGSAAAIGKPIIALLDNVLFYLKHASRAKKGEVVIFDRFVCATMIKLGSLDYNVEWMRPLWYNTRPEHCLIFDVPVEKSLSEIDERGDHIRYTNEQLNWERKQYLVFARKNGYPVFNTTRPYKEVRRNVRNYIGHIIGLNENKNELGGSQ